MNKKRAVFVCLLLAAVMLFSACANESKEDAVAGPPKGVDDTFVVASVNGRPIYYSQYYPQFSNACAYYGISEDDEINSAFVKQMVLDGLVETEIMSQAYEDNGYFNLSEQQLAQIEEDVQSEIDMILEYYYSTDMESELGEDYTQNEYETVKAKYEQKALSDYGYSKEDIIKYYKMEIAEEAARADLVGDIEPTEQQVRAKYDEEVALAKESAENDPSYYEHILSEGLPVYYAPEGIRNVRHILIKFDDEILSAIDALKYDGYNKAADMLKESALAGIADKAQDVLQKIKSKEMSFKEAIDEYNEDTAMPEEGYPVAAVEKIRELLNKTEADEISFKEAVDEYNTYIEENNITPSYVTEFSFGAISLKSAGDITLVGTDFGYHIIEYFNDTAAGTADFESVRQQLYDSLSETLKQDRWDEIVKGWKDLAVVEYTEGDF